MKKVNKILLSIGAFAIGFCSVAVLGSKVFVEASDSTRLDNDSSLVNSFGKTDYPTNKNGQTYGNVCHVMVEDYPDLIGVVATNGKEGYVYKEDFVDEYIPQSPEEAVEYMKVLEELNNQGIYFRIIPVYESDGETVIGEFELCLDVGYTFDSDVSEEEIMKIVAEREKLYDESRSKGKYLKEDLKTVVTKALKNR